ncbi:hypothetical protein NG895_10385 [Aeoliella sp. ICT_H6.2]|uniref:Helix-turn-helix domain-containing protein n=1 Tax=Aeoliella straminimaris TaxID=2954799 RepID=A0A9X2F9W7_9BACT|nr:hypothetical protein [Aeoliella straminimaris]MCO6044313.1 hypothetical protein [Aeoliella straminimaris]
MSTTNFEEAMNHLAQFFAALTANSATSSDGGWPPTMQRKRACEYLDIGLTKFSELVKAGEIPKPFPIGGRDHWLR